MRLGDGRLIPLTGAGQDRRGTLTVWYSVYVPKPTAPYSRPMPLALKPPEGPSKATKAPLTVPVRPPLMHLVARQMPELNAAQAADVVVDTFLQGVGATA